MGNGHLQRFRLTTDCFVCVNDSGKVVGTFYYIAGKDIEPCYREIFDGKWNEYELNKTYAFDTVSFSEWLTDLRKVILEDTIE